MLAEVDSRGLVRRMAAVGEASAFTDTFSRPTPPVLDSEKQQTEQAGLRSREPSSSTDISNRSESLQGAMEAGRAGVAHEPHAPAKVKAASKVNSGDVDPCSGPVSDASDADALGPAQPAELNLPAGVAEEGSEDPPSEDSEDELDILDGPPPREGEKAILTASQRAGSCKRRALDRFTSARVSAACASYCKRHLSARGRDQRCLR